MAHKFGFTQRVSGVNPVCTCCNTIVAAGAGKSNVDAHVLHDDCGEKLAIVTAIKNDLQPVIKKLPDNFFKGTNILERMERACTIGAFTSAWKAFCEHLASAKMWIKDRFNHVVASLRRIAEQSRIKNILIPALNF